MVSKPVRSLICSAFSDVDRSRKVFELCHRKSFSSRVGTVTNGDTKHGVAGTGGRWAGATTALTQCKEGKVDQEDGDPSVVVRSTLAEILFLFKLEGNALPESGLADSRVLCAWCVPGLADGISHGCCAEHAAMIRNS